MKLDTKLLANILRVLQGTEEGAKYPNEESWYSAKEIADKLEISIQKASYYLAHLIELRLIHKHEWQTIKKPATYWRR